MKQPKFIIRRNLLTRKYRFTLVATNGQVILQSQRYKTLAGAEEEIRSIRWNAPIATIEHAYDA